MRAAGVLSTAMLTTTNIYTNNVMSTSLYPVRFCALHVKSRRTQAGCGLSPSSLLTSILDMTLQMLDDASVRCAVLVRFAIVLHGTARAHRGPRCASPGGMALLPFSQDGRQPIVYSEPAARLLEAARCLLRARMLQGRG